MAVVTAAPSCDPAEPVPANTVGTPSVGATDITYNLCAPAHDKYNSDSFQFSATPFADVHAATVAVYPVAFTLRIASRSATYNVRLLSAATFNGLPNFATADDPSTAVVLPL